MLPPELRDQAAEAIAATVAPGGTLLVISRGREPGEPEGAMPWPLTADELRALFGSRLAAVSFEDYFDDEDPPVRRLRASFRRLPANGRG